MRSRWGTAAVALAMLVAGTACGRFSASTAGNTTTTGDATVRTLPPLDTTTARPGSSGIYQPPPPAPTATTRDVCAPPNSTTRDDPSGFRLILTVAPRQCVARNDDLTLQLEIQNVSKQPLQYDSNQKTFFSILPEGDVSRPGWDDTRCKPREANPANGGPITVQPGERQVRAQAVYPGPKSQANREQCRVLQAGAYAVTATFTWCPSSDCGAGRQIGAAPLSIRVG